MLTSFCSVCSLCCWCIEYLVASRADLVSRIIHCSLLGWDFIVMLCGALVFILLFKYYKVLLRDVFTFRVHVLGFQGDHNIC